VGPQRGEQTAARTLWDFLREEGPYRRRWVTLARQHDLKVVASEVNQEAVRRLVTTWAEEAGELSADELYAPEKRPWKDRVSRAAAGRILSPNTLRIFIEAFGIRDYDAQHLWRLQQEGSTPSRQPLPVLSTELIVPSDEYWAHLFSDECVVGPDMVPRHNVTTLVLQSLVDGFDRIRARFDRNQIASISSANEEWLIGAPRLIGGSVSEVDIQIVKPPDKNADGMVLYTSEFAPSADLRTETRRLVPSAIEAGSLNLRFDKQTVPRDVWFVIWNDWRERFSADQAEQGETIVEPMRNTGFFHHDVTELRGCIVGYRWEW